MVRQFINRTIIVAAVLVMTLSILLPADSVYASDNSIGRVGNLRIRDYGDMISLSWSKASGKISGYTVFRNGKKFCTTAARERGVCIMTDKGHLYRFRVRAYYRYRVKQW